MTMALYRRLYAARGENNGGINPPHAATDGRKMAG